MVERAQASIFTDVIDRGQGPLVTPPPCGMAVGPHLPSLNLGGSLVSGHSCFSDSSSPVLPERGLAQVPTSCSLHVSLGAKSKPRRYQEQARA